MFLRLVPSFRTRSLERTERKIRRKRMANKKENKELKMTKKSELKDTI